MKIEATMRMQIEYEGPWREAHTTQVKTDKILLDLNIVAATILRDELTTLLAACDGRAAAQQPSRGDGPARARGGA